MPRPPRVFADGAIYHVYCRIGRGEPVFADPAEAHAFVDILRQVKGRDDFSLLAWCLMSNHYHLAMRTDRVPLWRTMRLVQGRFAKSFNRRHEVFGSVWQGRYKARLVEGERYLRQLIAYIHLNPVAAGTATDPAQHAMSGHREVLGLHVAEPLVDVAEALLAFGEKRESATNAYVETLQGVVRSRWVRHDPSRLPWWGARLLASERSIELEPRTEVARIDALGGGPDDPPEYGTSDDFLVAASTALGIDLDELSAPGSGREITMVREMVVLLGAERYHLRVRELAMSLGRSPAVVSRWISEGGRRRKADGRFRKALESVALALRTPVVPSQSEGSGFLTGDTGSFVD